MTAEQRTSTDPCPSARPPTRSSPATTTATTTATAGTTYAGTDSNQCAVRIQAVVGNGAWYTPWSNWSVPPLGAPTITASNITDAGLQIDFTAPAVSPAATITDYYAEFSNDGGATVAYGPVSLGQTTSPIVSNYYYGYYYGYCGYYYYDQNNPNQCAVRIRAVIGNGAWYSPWSNWSTAPLAAPTITAATLVDGGVQLDITPPAVAPGATITDYYVEISTDGGASAYGPYSVGQTSGPLFVPQAFYFCASDGTGLCALRVLAVIGNGAWYSPWSSWRTFTDDVAPTASLSLDSTSGTAPFNVAATVVGADPDNTPLTYSLDFGDGTPVADRLAAFGAGRAHLPRVGCVHRPVGGQRRRAQRGNHRVGQRRAVRATRGERG